MAIDPKAREPYIVTDKGGPRPDIAGRLRVVGTQLMLTHAEAEYELKRGVIVTLEDHEAAEAAAKSDKDPGRGNADKD